MSDFRLIPLLIAFAFSLSQAAIIEDTVEIKIPVKTTLSTSTEKIVVTIWHDDTKTNTPFVLINHGRSASPTDREKFGRGRYVKESKRLVELGFTVLVPTRIGYGVSGGPDLEYTPTKLSHANYQHAFEVMATEGVHVVKLAQTLPYVNPENGALIGISYGGAMVIAMSTKNIPSIKAILNLSGGVGGDPIKNPGNPRDPQNAEDIFRAYGKLSKIPTVWVYAKNDEYWGKEIPIQWFKAFAEGGSKTVMYHLGTSTAGHSVFRKDFDTWFPIFTKLAKEHNIL
ncbi:dienelactone hydrolase family protein [Sulfurospirillum oryzae]|uniref:dienelactone hydrolase family protein n=1 Tax=Sulfurospirillum oryzae TaxID=2976535 RepID=UPI0021E954F8|nr:CocE/NonD family hydrolase [Sulfurospirillum oryzae]